MSSSITQWPPMSSIFGGGPVQRPRFQMFGALRNPPTLPASIPAQSFPHQHAVSSPTDSTLDNQNVDLVPKPPHRGPSKSADPKHLSFLDLPAEMRNKIYYHALVAHSPKCGAHEPDIGFDFVRGPRAYEHGLSRTCRQVRAESLELMYSKRNFNVAFQNASMIVWCPVVHWLERLGVHYSRMIRHIYVYVGDATAWGDVAKWIKVREKYLAPEAKIMFMGSTTLGLALTTACDMASKLRASGMDWDFVQEFCNAQETLVGAALGYGMQSWPDGADAMAFMEELNGEGDGGTDLDEEDEDEDDDDYGEDNEDDDDNLDEDDDEEGEDDDEFSSSFGADEDEDEDIPTLI